MKVTHVAVRPSVMSDLHLRPALTPELLAAVGARYSRNNEGLEAILQKIDPDNPDKSVDSIFRMIDYGHQSIADMVPVAMFLDDISVYAAYHIWSLCPTAGGQESSTRYVKMDESGLLTPEQLGVPYNDQPLWRTQMAEAFAAYKQALTLWEELTESRPELCRIPAGVNEKAAARMRRNFAFDRARCFIPVACKTNMMLIMSARGWVQLCQQLLSSPLPELNDIGRAIRTELELPAPRMVKHAAAKEYITEGLAHEFHEMVQLVRGYYPKGLPSLLGCERCESTLHVEPPNGVTNGDIRRALQFHPNRYAWVGSALARTSVRFAWSAVSMGEIRDLNRHRTGTKYCPLIPQGFYNAVDQVPNDEPFLRTKLSRLGDVGGKVSMWTLRGLRESEPSYIYWSLLGTQYPFEHLTTGDKFIYEAELRTGTGAHYRYAQHLRDMLALWYERFPESHGLVLEGSAEPE